jgi:hypothetical protein
MDNSTLQDAVIALNTVSPKLPTKSKARVLKSVTVDIEQLKAIASKFNIEIKPGKGQGVNKAIQDLFQHLEVIETSMTAQSEETSQAIDQIVAHQALALTWLTSEIETLRDTIKRMESNQAIISTADDEHLSQLQAQIHHLIAENQELKTALASHKRAIKALTNSDEEGDGDNNNGAISSRLNTPTIARSEAPEQRSKVSRTRKSGGAKARAISVFHAVQLWNQNNPSQAVFINQALLNQEFNISRPAVQAFLDEFQQDVQLENNKLGEFPRSRNKPEDIEALKQFVTQQIEQTGSYTID